jgi:U6 snRNA-associated Sm-like protein LSm2
MSHIWRKKTKLNWKKGVFCLVGWLVGWCVWVCLLQQLFFSYFKELVGKVVTVELKNDLAITGILHSVDQYLNIKLEDTRVVDEAKYPHMVRTFSSTSRVFVVRPLLFFFFLFRLCFVIF